VHAQTTGFAGAVIDLATGAPIQGATIQVEGQTAVTDAQGRYALAVLPGLHEVRAEADGYIGMTHTLQRSLAGQVRELGFEMIPRSPTAEQEAVIQAKLLREPAEAQALFAEIDEAELYQVATVPSTVRVGMLDGTIVTMTMDEYLKGVVPHEMSPSWPLEALKAQAVAARSYAATNQKHAAEGYDVCTTTHCQYWAPTHYDTTDVAVDATHGQAALYDGSIIYAFYHGHCDGHTRRYREVWGGGSVDIPYLQSVECPCGYDQLWGHGVGMCQEGARAMARDQGSDYVEILQHYYAGVTVPGPTPNLITSAQVTPAAGTDLTEFVFTATYDGPSLVLPAAAHVVIDGRAYAMERLPSAVGSGYHYRLVMRLPAGGHSHYYYFDDGYGNASRLPASGSFGGPSVSASLPDAPAPTPIPALSEMARSHSLTTSTAVDWSWGEHDGTVIAESVGEGAVVLAAGRDSGVYTSPVLALPERCDAVALTWVAQDPPELSWLQPRPVALEVRTRLAGTSWLAWQAVPPSDANGSRGRLSMSDLRFGGADEVQFRATLVKTSLAEPVLEQVRVVGLVIDDDRAPIEVTSLGIVSREGWGADERLRSAGTSYRTPRIVILHHTGASLGGMPAARAMRGLYYYDAVVREVGDLGVHYVIDGDGTIYEGRYGGVGVVGQHASQYDYHSVAIALLGDMDTEAPSADMLASLTDLLARLGRNLGIPATESRVFQNITPPAMAGLNELYARQAPRSPGANVVARLAEIRSAALAKMTKLPVDGERVGGIVPLEVEATSGIAEVAFAVNGAVRHVAAEAPYLWHWHAYAESEGANTLGIIIRSDGGESSITRQVQVDHTPPTGVGVTTPAWTNRRALDLATGDATHVQVGNGWVWEGEDLYHGPNTGSAVSDSAAINGVTWQAVPPMQGAGDWFGPYACALPAWDDYEVSFRMRLASPAGSGTLATIKVQDEQGRRIYAHRSVTADMLPADGSYTEINLNLPYQSVLPTCGDPDRSDGLEFFVHYTGAGGLALDRVTVWRARQAVTGTIYDALPEQDGLHTVDLRFLDAAGNAVTQHVTIGLDRTKPVWSGISDRSAVVQDTLSGIDTDNVFWADSVDGGETWGPWRLLSLSAPLGTVEPVTLAAPDEAGPLVRFQARDRAGNVTINRDASLLALPCILRNAGGH